MYSDPRPVNNMISAHAETAFSKVYLVLMITIAFPMKDYPLVLLKDDPVVNDIAKFAEIFHHKLVGCVEIKTRDRYSNFLFACRSNKSSFGSVCYSDAFIFTEYVKVNCIDKPQMNASILLNEFLILFFNVDTKSLE